MKMMPDEKREPLRVLQLSSGSRNFGGVSSFLFQMYKEIDRTRIQFDFLAPEETTYGPVREEIRDMGGRIIEFHIGGSALIKKIRLYVRRRRFLLKHPYRIVHMNSGNFFFNLTASAAAKSAHVPVRIVHSHNAGDAGMPLLRRVLFRVLKRVLERQATLLAACSLKAARYMFTDAAVESGRIRIIRNGIDPDRFAPDAEVRRAMRKTLGIDGCLVIGHAGRFMKQKNHVFLLDIFREVHRRRPDAVLILLGDGELKEEIRELAARYGLMDSVRMPGQQRDMEKWYQAMDVFTLPSLHEGLPVSALEAQAAGLPLVLSDEITDEVRILDAVTFLPLSASPGMWADELIRAEGIRIADGPAKVKEAGYSVEQTAKEMERIYLSEEE